ncbi:mRNA interferase ChpB [Thiorhodovibrio winogradskyi]|uniref:mRNA interferase ChpB n=1 Tax=Thiorhodovibrio winogradskyi TaxID=77007 RepID=A0ABZ0SE65_9GAMM|nr:type II toxin-antitoxin system PemK/MazF family toxin [Thiorhodovibrio winogradskyi]
MPYLPNRGDIVHLDFDPSSGREMQGPHFGLVVSGKLFNQQGMAIGEKVPGSSFFSWFAHFSGCIIGFHTQFLINARWEFAQVKNARLHAV